MNQNLICRGGGIEPLRVFMPFELKSSPSTIPTHHGMPLQQITIELQLWLSLPYSGSIVHPPRACFALLWEHNPPTVGLEPTTTRLKALRSAD